MAIDIKELQELLDSATTSAAKSKDIRKGLSRIENLIANLTTEVANVYSLLDGAEPAKKERKARAPRALGVEQNPEHPYGTKADGTPKSKPGRSKAKAE